MADKHIISAGIAFHDARDNVIENFAEGFATLAEIGFQGVDFPIMCLNGVKENRDATIQKIAEQAKESGIQFAQGHLPFIGQSAGTPDLESFKPVVFDALDAAKALGIQYAVMHPNSASVPLERYNKTAEYDNVMNYFAPFVEYANKIGVDMVVENMRSLKTGAPAHRYCAAPDELCDIADACGIGVCWDTGHANITGLCQSEALRYVGDRLKVVHLNDNEGQGDVHYVPYMGNVNWADVMAGLKAIGFQGPINFEVACGGVPLYARKDMGKYVCKIGEYFRTML